MPLQEVCKGLLDDLADVNDPDKATFTLDLPDIKYSLRALESIFQDVLSTSKDLDLAEQAILKTSQIENVSVEKGSTKFGMRFS
jgi:hypothetical protein